MGLLSDLFFTFAKIGLFTFGGGYAMISLIENSCVEKNSGSPTMRWSTTPSSKA
ncbi:MAG: chromate transporter [Eubacteriaceae bacterium]|nr:chromate transporter [Eubacteriaceae bacterium]